MVDLTIDDYGMVNGVYKPTCNMGGPSSTNGAISSNTLISDLCMYIYIYSSMWYHWDEIGVAVGRHLQSPNATFSKGRWGFHSGCNWVCQRAEGLQVRRLRHRGHWSWEWTLTVLRLKVCLCFIRFPHSTPVLVDKSLGRLENQEMNHLQTCIQVPM